VVVATPGRLAHQLKEVQGFTLGGVEFLVFDEADRLFEMGFAEQIKQVWRRVRVGVGGVFGGCLEGGLPLWWWWWWCVSLHLVAWCLKTELTHVRHGRGLRV
jgi:hypothetical protein